MHPGFSLESDGPDMNRIPGFKALNQVSGIFRYNLNSFRLLITGFDISIYIYEPKIKESLQKIL
jgi:hypothetical protein